MYIEFWHKMLFINKIILLTKIYRLYQKNKFAIGKSNQEAKEKSLNFLLYKDQGFWYNLSFKLPLVLLLVIIFLLFLKIVEIRIF